MSLLNGVEVEDPLEDRVAADRTRCHVRRVRRVEGPLEDRGQHDHHPHRDHHRTTLRHLRGQHLHLGQQQIPSVEAV